MWKKYAKFALQHAKHFGQSGTWYSSRYGPYFKKAVSHASHFKSAPRRDSSNYSAVQQWRRYWFPGKSALAWDAAKFIKIYGTNALFRRIVNYGLGGLVAAAMARLDDGQKAIFVYCLQKEYEASKRVTPKTIRNCYGRAVQTRDSNRKSFRSRKFHNGSGYY